MPRPTIEFDAPSHTYIVNGEEGYPSVTGILGSTVAKPFGIAANWGYKLGVEAAHILVQDHFERDLFTGDTFEGALKRAKSVQTPNSVRDKAGDRGTAIHEALERYGKSGEIPVPADFNEEDHARITGIAKWLVENRPEFLGSEIRTASLEHRYVGTLDAEVLFEAGEYEGKRARIDFKTSSRVYPDEHFVQLAAYEQAEIECGEEPSDVRLVVHIPQSGKCKSVLADREFEDFAILLAVYERKNHWKNLRKSA